jgi:hypothetical protein
MIGAKLEDLRAAVAVARQPVTDGDAFAGAMESFTREYAEWKSRFDQLIGEPQAPPPFRKALATLTIGRPRAGPACGRSTSGSVRGREAQPEAFRQLCERVEALQ